MHLLFQVDMKFNPLALREDHRFRVYSSKMLIRIFGPKTEEETRDEKTG